MKTNVEKQVAAFDQVLGLCNKLGTKYNPSKDSLKVAALNSVLTSAVSSIQAVDNAKSALTKAVNARQKAFAPLPGIGTRILNVLIASDASPQVIADARLYRDKLRGTMSAKTPKPEDSTTTTPPADASRGPVSYLDHESKIRNFGLLVDLLRDEPLYKTNEPEFSIAALTTLLASLKERNKAVRDAMLTLQYTRHLRNIAVFSEAGVYGTAKRVKKYILYAFGATSEQYRMANSYHIRQK
jgi:hypothetical protein